MASTNKSSISLSDEMAHQVRARVVSGQYASEDEVIREGLRALADQEHAFEKWVREEVIPICQATIDNPSSRRTLEQVKQRLEKEHQRLIGK